MTASFDVIIPARYGASRLPGKLLRDIAGKPMIQRTYERARESKAEQIIVATDAVSYTHLTLPTNREV